MSRTLTILVLAGTITGCSLFRKLPHDGAAELVHVVAPVRAGAAITVPVHLAGQSSVALQFDLEFDADTLELTGAEAAPGLRAVGKALTARPLGRGVARVVVFGQNLDALPSGLQGTVRFRATRGAKVTAFRAVRRAAAAADGRELASHVRPGRIVIGEVLP